MIVELNGLPGSGKTVLKKAVIQSMDANHMTSAGVDEFRGNGKSEWRKLLIKIYRYISQFSPGNLSMYALCRKSIYPVSQDIHPWGYQSDYECKIVIMYLIYLYQIYRRNPKKTLVIDEGIIQTLTAISVHMQNADVAVKKILNKFKSCTNDVLFVNINISLEETYHNIQNRNRHDSAMDSLQGELLKDFLKHYHKRLKQSRDKINKSKVIEVSSKKSALDQSAMHIIERITNSE